jgi:hypothetical protein
MNFNKAAMHRVPTYDEIIKDTIIAPKDKIELPDRMATQLRNSPQLTRFDDESDLNLADEHDKISKEKIRAIEVRNQASVINNYYNTTITHTTEDPPTTTLPGQPPPRPAQTQASASADPYFGGRPTPPTRGSNDPIISAFQNDIQQRLQDDYHESQSHLDEMKRLREDAKKKFVDDIRVEFGGWKQNIAAEMTDVNMLTRAGGVRRKLVGKQKHPQHTTQAEETDTPAASVEEPRSRIVIGKQTPQPGDPTPPAASVEEPRRRIVIGKQTPQPGDPTPPAPPQPENTPEEELQNPKVLIQAPSRVKMPELFALIKKALQHDTVDEEMTASFRRIEAQIVDGNYDEISKAEHKELKRIYKTAVWDRAKTHRGGGRFAPIY